MTGNQNQKDNQFTAQADSAAQRLRGDLQRQGRQIPDTASVTVGPDGKPPAPPPPEGSYARMQLEQRQREQAQKSTGQPTRAEQLGDQPEAGTVEQAMDGSQGPRLDGGQESAEQSKGTSPRAERRIQELVHALREKEQELERFKQQSDSESEWRSKYEALKQQHEQHLTEHLDQLDPETQREILLSQKLNDMLVQFEKRIDQKYAPQLQSIENRNIQSEMAALSERYPMFDVQVHGPLIEIYRGKNPYSTIEQAWKAIAEPDELVTRSSASAAAVPPVVPPGQHDLSNVRYASEPEQQSDPEAEMVEESRRIKELRSSLDPEEQKKGLALVHQNLARRLGL